MHDSPLLNKTESLVHFYSILKSANGLFNVTPLHCTEIVPLKRQEREDEWSGKSEFGIIASIFSC